MHEANEPLKSHTCCYSFFTSCQLLKIPPENWIFAAGHLLLFAVYTSCYSEIKLGHDFAGEEIPVGLKLGSWTIKINCIYLQTVCQLT